MGVCQQRPDEADLCWPKWTGLLGVRSHIRFVHWRIVKSNILAWGFPIYPLWDWDGLGSCFRTDGNQEEKNDEGQQLWEEHMCLHHQKGGTVPLVRWLSHACQEALCEAWLRLRIASILLWIKIQGGLWYNSFDSSYLTFVRKWSEHEEGVQKLPKVVLEGEVHVLPA